MKIKNKISFMKFEINGTIYSVVMKIENEKGERSEIDVSNHQDCPKIQRYDTWLARTMDVKATKKEFSEMYSKVAGMLTETIINSL